MKKGAWQRSLINALVLWMVIFPVMKILADLVRARSFDLSGAGYFWSFAFRGNWTNIGVSLAYIALWIAVTAGILRVSRKSLLN